MIYVKFNRPVPSPLNNGMLCTFFEFDPNACDVEMGYCVKHFSDAIEFLSLSGTDLDNISYRFNHIPVNVKLDTNTYRGEFARFIMENW